MEEQVDKTFYERADEHIKLSNEQLKSQAKGRVSASMMFGLARFNSWLSASGWNNAEEMKEAKEKTIEYFITEYKSMLSENLDDYIKNFDLYMNPRIQEKKSKKETKKK